LKADTIDKKRIIEEMAVISDFESGKDVLESL